MDPLVYLRLVAGLIYLLGGGDLLVRGAVALARRTGVPPVVVALSVVAFATSLPELVVAVRAALSGYPGLVLGSVIGSNVANVLLVVGASAAVFPLACGEGPVRRNGSIMLGVCFLFAALSLSGEVTRFEGIALLVGLVAVLGLTARTSIRAFGRADTTIPLDWVLGLPSSLGTILLFIGIGVVILPLGAGFLVEAAVDIAQEVGVSNTVVGLSVVAIGTSLPELTTAVLAALQRRSDVAIGTIIGSNTFNILAIMGVGATISPSPVQVSPHVMSFHLPIMVGVSAIPVLYAWSGKRIGRRAGIALLLGYVAYLWTLY